MLDGIRLGLDMVGLFILGGMLLYSVRLLVATRGGILSKGWKSIVLGTISLSAGLASNVINSAIGMTMLFLYSSVVLMNIGGILLVIGLRYELGAWSLKRVKDQPN